MAKIRDKLRRILIGTVGGIVLVIGVIAIPYPGPGWLIVFIGLSILATEFTWAQRLHDFARSKYDVWQDWLERQPRKVKAIFWILTCVVVVATIWLLNGYGLMNDWFNLGQDWVKSPLFTK